VSPGLATLIAAWIDSPGITAITLDACADDAMPALSPMATPAAHAAIVNFLITHQLR
jgi:hypothetical protein